jgi:hypothetical protein
VVIGRYCPDQSAIALKTTDPSSRQGERPRSKKNVIVNREKRTRERLVMGP